MNTTKMNAIKIIIRFALRSLYRRDSSGSCPPRTPRLPAGVGQMFRLDGGDVTYVFGVNERGELQALYWGGKLAASDKVAAAHSLPEMASFDSPSTTTPQEYAAWGAGLFTEPALKITFADGNRDLVLHYVSSKSTAERIRSPHQRHLARNLRHAALRDGRRKRHPRPLRRNRKSRQRRRDRRASRRRAMDAAAVALHAQLSHRPLGRRVDAESRTNPGRLARHRKPSRLNRPSGQSVVRDLARRQPKIQRPALRRRRTRRSLVRRARVVRFLALHHRKDAARFRPRHRRLQSIRFRLQAQARRKTRDADFLRRLLQSRSRRRVTHPA